MAPILPTSFGIEEEYLLVDPETRELAADPEEGVIRDVQAALADRDIGFAMPEFLQAQVEVATSVSPTLAATATKLKALRRTVIEVHSMLATVGHSSNPGSKRHDYVPPLNNETLFKRDAWLCMYCGGRFPPSQLSRDHVRPLYQGGRDVWKNVVAACRRCNNHKASRTPEQAGLQLLAVPFTPTYAEYIYLKGRRVLADQMEYLLAHFPRSSPLHDRIQRWMQ